MADTLTLAGVSTLGLVPGSAQVLLAPDGDVGSPTPDTAVVSSLLLDGDVVTGERYSNRHFSLPFVVFGTSRANLSATLDAFLLAVSAQTWQMVWTPNTCPSTVWNCFRATPHVQWSPRQQSGLSVLVSLEFDAQPFAFSAATRSVTVAATGGPTPLQVDSMNTGTFTTGTLDTTTKYEGAGSCKAAGNLLSNVGHAGRTVTSTSLSAYGSVSVRVKLDAAAAHVSVTLTLGDASSGSRGVATTVALTTGWTLVQFQLADFPGIDLAHITSWQVSIDATGSAATTGWVDDLRAWPAGSVGNSTAEGTVLNVPSIYGSARTPVALAVARASGTMTNLLLHSPPATQDPDLTILAGLSVGSVTIPDANMNYDGTYSIVVFFSASVGGATSRVITVTLTQKVGATTVGTATLTATLIGTQTIASIGQIALPLTAVPSDNITGSLIIAVTSGNGTDAFSDVALCDTEGQTVMLTGLATPTSVYVDAPDPTTGVGPIYASTTADRTAAVSVASLAIAPGGPVQFEPVGVNKLLAASTSGAPNVTFTYTPAWLHEALI